MSATKMVELDPESSSVGNQADNDRSSIDSPPKISKFKNEKIENIPQKVEKPESKAITTFSVGNPFDKVFGELKNNLKIEAVANSALLELAEEIDNEFEASNNRAKALSKLQTLHSNFRTILSTQDDDIEKKNLEVLAKKLMSGEKLIHEILKPKDDS